MARSEEWNDDIKSDIGHADYSDLVVYSRDWTVDTILAQLRQGNIDINPRFQRRNAWTDKRRSLLIESLILGIPVPELVLAESPESKKTFIVLDGKQRLLALAGFIDHDEIESWNNPILQGLETRDSLNGKTFRRLSEQDSRSLINADVRCTVISHYSDENILYDIFYRLNTGSVALSTQELRQVLKRGQFANFLIATTNDPHPIQEILGLTQPDNRLRDIEILLRYFAFRLEAVQYRGNLKKFLDDTMEHCNSKWGELEVVIERIDRQLSDVVALGGRLLDGVKHIGRKIVEGHPQKQFNKAVFDVHAFYFTKLFEGGLTASAVTEAQLASFRNAHLALWTNDEFVRSVEVTTKSIEQYRRRFINFEKVVNESFGTSFTDAGRLFPD